MLDAPERSSQNDELIYSTKCAWSSMHKRIEHYYRGRRKNRWFLWNNWVNDNEIPSEWNWDYLSYVEGSASVDIETIAVHLLMPTCSLRNKIARIVEKIGTVNMSAVAFESSVIDIP